MKGYFAFPPNAPPRIPFTFKQNSPAQPDSQKLSDEYKKQQAWEERCRLDQERRRQRLEREQEEIWKGELHWVRSGGIVRDVYGRRDHARMVKLLAEIRLQDQEKLILERWNAYETRWRTLLASGDPVAWSDIPWPTPTAPATVDGLTPQAVAEFVFSPLTVRGATGSRKEKLRASILRWHPDKVSLVLSRVVDEQQDTVREGVNTAFIVLRQLQDAEKNSS